jgi:hypothetical protein
MSLAVSSRSIPKTRIHQDSRSTSFKRPRRRYVFRRAKTSPSRLETPSESSPFVDIFLEAAGRDDGLSFEVAMVSRDVQGAWKTGDEVSSYRVDHCAKARQSRGTCMTTAAQCTVHQVAERRCTRRKSQEELTKCYFQYLSRGDREAE